MIDISRRSQILTLSTFVIIVIAGQRLAFSASDQPIQVGSDKSVSSPSEFEKNIKGLRQKLESQGSKMDELATLVLDRLREYRATSNNSVIEAVQALKSSEGKIQIEQNGGKVPSTLTYPSTKAFIESAIPLLQGNPPLQSQLWSEAASIATAAGDLPGAAKALQKAADIISPSQLEGDLLRLSIFVELGDIQARTGHKALAEDAYRQVLAYSWYLIEDPVLQRRAFEMYLTAGKGLIECSRHDLKALQNIFFVPSTLQILGPILDQAVKEATDEAARPQGSRGR